MPEAASKTAWLFPGQGTQKVGMGLALYETSPAARDVFERADRALGWSLSELCFEGPEEKLTLTEHAQPAIVATSIAALSALEELHGSLPNPDFAAGHSLGEYSALVAAGALTLEEAVRLVHLRGAAMQRAVPPGAGGMAAIIGADDARVEELCREAARDDVLAPANFNAPGQTVVAGHAAAIERVMALAAESKLKAIPLRVSAPFHCSLMRPAARELAAALRAVHPRELAFAVVSNVDATPNRDASKVADLLVRQMDAPVRFRQSISLMADAGVVHAFEIGPGSVLSGLVKRIDKRIRVESVSDPESLAAARATTGALPCDAARQENPGRPTLPGSSPE